MENTASHHEDLPAGVAQILEEEHVRADRVFSRDRRSFDHRQQQHHFLPVTTTVSTSAIDREAGVGETERVIEEEEDINNNSDSNNNQKKKKSYTGIAVLYLFYNVAFSMTIPALPALMLRLNDDDSSRSSYLYGLTVFVRYIIEFFCAPLLGSLEDLYGRKIMLFLSFITFAVEFLLLAFFPSVGMIFLTRAMAGAADSALPTSYTIMTDIALFNGDSVTKQFGLLGAMSGVGFVLGPVLGGYLCDVSIELNFLVSAGCSFAGAVMTLLILEETLYLGKKKEDISNEKTTCRCVRFSDFNPIPALLMHFSNKDLRELTVPLAMSSFTLGVGFIWYIFMDFQFEATATEIGVYLAFYGVVNATIQGLVIRRLIPNRTNELRASIYGFLLLALQTAGYGLSVKQWMLYLMVALFTIGNISDPALKALIVKESMRQPDGILFQGNLQGVLCSVRTLGQAFGSLMFSSLFAFCVDQKPALPFVPFLLASFLYSLSALYLYVKFRNTKEWTNEAKGIEDDDQTRKKLLEHEDR